ncbi:MAG: hypothetical protein AB1349_12505 [Elusimicrobiota bacterium]
MSRILADENIHITLIDELIKNGHDVETVVNRKFVGASNRIIKELISVISEVKKDFEREPGLLVVLTEGRYRIHKPMSGN